MNQLKLASDSVVREERENTCPECEPDAAFKVPLTSYTTQCQLNGNPTLARNAHNRTHRTQFVSKTHAHRFRVGGRVKCCIYRLRTQRRKRCGPRCVSTQCRM